ncbi:MAG: hypothetical protein VYE63_02455, partial [Candidatus Neomarinimicrobiota bacterium]|nr:hypothetical protein [Candidatus Neomarinimicrobiota bacterium]
MRKILFIIPIVFISFIISCGTKNNCDESVENAARQFGVDSGFVYELSEMPIQKITQGAEENIYYVTVQP